MCRKNYWTPGSRTRKIWLLGMRLRFHLDFKHLEMPSFSPILSLSGSGSITFYLTAFLYSFTRWTPLTDTLLRSSCVSKRKDCRHAASIRIPEPLPASNPLGTYTLFTLSYKPLLTRFSLNHPLMHTPVVSTSIPNACRFCETRTNKFFFLPRNIWHLSTGCASLNFMYY